MPKQNEYEGMRINGQTLVRVNGYPLNPRYDLRQHSPTGLEWGYGGSGPAQLALAILAHEYGNKFAEAWYQDFKWAVIARLPCRAWNLTSEEIQHAMQRLMSESLSGLLAESLTSETSYA